MTGSILWDFDGTLAHRPGMWHGCILETLDEQEPGHAVTADQLVPFLATGFPWHTPDVPHPELCEPGAWWRRVESLLVRAFEGVGHHDRAVTLARLVRERYVDGRCAWQLYPETRETLVMLQEEGWEHIVLSNHVPELEDILAAVGLARYISAIVNSAVTGYEKPHPRAFELAASRAGHPTNLWMVGDNPDADVRGAESVGIPAILVRGSDKNVSRCAADLAAAAAVIRSHAA